MSLTRYSVSTSIAVALAVAALAMGGCMTTSPRLHSFASALDRDLPEVELDHQFGMTFGRMSLGMVKGIAKWGMDEEDQDAFAAFRGVRKVEFATYQAHLSGAGESSVLTNSDWDAATRLQAKFRRNGWQTMARFSADAELGWVVYRLSGDKLKNVMVVLLEDEELTIVRLGGKLNKVVRAALAYSRSEVLDDHDFDDKDEPDRLSTEELREGTH